MTRTLTLIKHPDGRYRTEWEDAIGVSHCRDFGRNRVTAQLDFEAFHNRWLTDPSLRTPSFSMRRPAALYGTATYGVGVYS